ncbi:antibiotic biosynthesis monooxygenase family protein [Luteimonas salinilitoris]|uniref:Antibiotic biosynthesis monooxygenase n=1 Tax=Luteimonas salinilitoris TaxID=3237697 RepID=A0ABV4HRN3_9GAMM
MFVVIWEYEIRADATDAFESMYGADGAWVALFRQAPGYLGTELLRDRRPRRYLSLDRWATEADYDAFLAATGARYAELDALGDALTLAERRIGRYRAPC